MYLLNNTIQYIEDPWPHIIINNALPIDVADYMLANFPVTGDTQKERLQNKFIGYPADSVFEEFHEINTDRQQEFHSTLNMLFSQQEEDLINTRYSFKVTNPSDPYKIKKKWHTDASDKKYKILVYLGSGEGGWLELGNPETRQLKRYEYKHNRAIIYNNSKLSFHRFYSSNVPRYTLGFSVKFKDPNKNNYDNTYESLQMQDDLW
jgi:hypothetical protein